MILRGDCIEVMKAMKPNSIDAVVTDPPYGLEFMGKEWDRLVDKKPAYNEKIAKHKDNGRHGGGNNPYVQSRITYKAGLQAQLWHSQWLTEAYRVLKPGGSMLVMGGTRTFHRLACAIEDSGFIIKDTLMWLYGSGFPKAQDLGKMIDKRNGDSEGWHGFKVGGIKPAYEPIIWAVKPPEGSYIDNVLKWGVGAVNVDECRIRIDENEDALRIRNNTKAVGSGGKYEGGYKVIPTSGNSQGRFPANLILSHHPECVRKGVKRVKGVGWKDKDKTASESKYRPNQGNYPFEAPHYTDKDGLETVENWNCHPDCPVRLLDEQSGVSKPHGKPNNNSSMGGIFGNAQPCNSLNQYQGNGGASRFFYCAKASRGERNAGLEGMEEKEATTYHDETKEGAKTRGRQPRHNHLVKNNHPCVKPIALFEYLIKLVTREGQVVLDPFLGSGTTAIAAHKVGRKCVGIEREADYIEIAKKRIEHWQSQPQQMAL